MHFHLFVSVCVWERKERHSYLEALQSVSMNGLSRGKLSLIVKLFGRSLFLHHLMLNSSTFPCHFFLPLRMSSDQVFLANGFLLRSKWPRQMYGAPKRALAFIMIKQKEKKRLLLLWLGITRLNIVIWSSVYRALTRLAFCIHSKTALIHIWPLGGRWQNSWQTIDL